MKWGVGINGFDRMGRWALRVIEQRDDLEVVAINGPFATADVLATRTEFDSQQDRVDLDCRDEGSTVLRRGRDSRLDRYRPRGARRVVVSVPVKGSPPSVRNASLTNCVVVSRDTTVDEVNAVFESATRSPRLSGILGYETRPLVSRDFAGDARSSIVDAPSTRVTDHRLVKTLAWYDNEWGYVNRMVELAALSASYLVRQ